MNTFKTLTLRNLDTEWSFNRILNKYMNDSGISTAGKAILSIVNDYKKACDIIEEYTQRREADRKTIEEYQKNERIYKNLIRLTKQSKAEYEENLNLLLDFAD